MVNLLPEITQQKLSALYWTRLAALALFLLSLAGIIGVAGLLPSYFIASAEADAAAHSLAASQQALQLGEKGGAPGTLALWTERVALLKDYPRPPLAASALSTLTAGLPPGVTFSKIVLTPEDGAHGTISLSGKAATRDALLAFVKELQGKSAFSGVSVPVADLATETDVPFSLSFSFSLPHS